MCEIAKAYLICLQLRGLTRLKITAIDISLTKISIFESKSGGYIMRKYPQHL